MHVHLRGTATGRRRLAPATAGLILACAGVLTLPDAASSTTPGPNGRISFMRQDDGGHWQVWTANPDLTHQHRLTDGPYDSGWATWSPDGTRLAFDSARIAPDAHGDLKEIFTMASDGSDVRQVTDLGFFAGQPSWSLDGRWIAFTSDGGDYPATQGIYVVHPDGSALRRVVSLPSGPRAGWLDAPRFSPDGTQLAYTFYQGGKETPASWPWKGEVSSLWVVDLDGGNPHQVVASGQKVGDADWSPDGRYLTFEQVANDPGTITSVRRVPAGGGAVTALTRDKGYLGGRSGNWVFEASFDPVYSPDGTRILFSHDDYTPTAGCTGLQIMAADGGGQHWVDARCGVEHQVDWGTAPLE
jgi:Tol biopolymer transport system component